MQATSPKHLYYDETETDYDCAAPDEATDEEARAKAFIQKELLSKAKQAAHHQHERRHALGHPSGESERSSDTWDLAKTDFRLGSLVQRVLASGRAIVQQRPVGVDSRHSQGHE